MKLFYALLFFTVCGFANAQNENENYIPLFSKRMFNANEIIPREAPYMAVVKIVYYNAFCIATLISKRLLITTAKFLYIHRGEKMEVAMGFYDTDPINSSQIYTIKNVHIHENFTPYEEYNDIALIELQKDVRKSSHMKPIPLLLPNDILRRGSLFMKILGYGNSSIINERENGMSSGILRSMSVLVNTEIVNLGASLIVARTVDLTNGDSGAPLIFHGKLAGVATYTDEISKGMPAIFTGIVNHYEWIGKILADNVFKSIAENSVQ